MASVLEGFLVRLGFEVDKESQQKFRQALDSGTALVKDLGKKTIGVGTAVVAAYLKSTQSLSQLYNFARKTGTSLESVQTLGEAFKFVGGTAEDANSVIAGISQSLKTIPNAAGFLKSKLGVNIKDANGKLKDTAQIFLEIRNSLSKMDAGYARELANVLHIGDKFDVMMREDFIENVKRANKITGEWKGALSDTAPEANKVWNEVGLLTDSLKNGLLVAAGEFSKETGLSAWLENLNNELPKTLKSVIDAEKDMMKESDGFMSWLGKWLFQADDYLLAARERNGEDIGEEGRKRLDEIKFRKRVDAGKAIREKSEEIGFKAEDYQESEYALTDEDSALEGIWRGMKPEKPEAEPVKEPAPKKAESVPAPVKEPTSKKVESAPVPAKEKTVVEKLKETVVEKLKEKPVETKEAPVKEKPVVTTIEPKKAPETKVKFPEMPKPLKPEVVVKPIPVKDTKPAPVYSPEGAKKEANATANANGASVTNNSTNVSITQTMHFHGATNPTETARTVREETSIALSRSVNTNLA